MIASRWSRRLACCTAFLLAAPSCADDGSGAPETGTGSSTAAQTTDATSTPPTTTTDSTDSTDAGTAGSVSDTATTSGGSTTAAPTSGSTTSANDSTGTTGGAAVCDGEFPTQWANGTACNGEDAIQVHRYDENTFILRQSLCTSFEGPFLYLLFGQDRVLLEDTGHGGIPLQQTVQAIIDQWLAEQGKDSIELVVVNSHAHGDHVAGNTQFVGQPDTTVVGYGVNNRAGYFGITDWPNEIVQYDLGGRVLDIIPIPGHEGSHIAIYDPEEGLLLTGDTLYAGRLYINDFPTYVQSIDRLVAHVTDQEVCWVLGTHIEMTSTPGEDFEFGAAAHPDEHPLQLELDHLLELQAAVSAMGTPMIEVHDDFIIYPL